MNRTRAWLNAFKPAFQKSVPKVDQEDRELVELLRRAEERRRSEAQRRGHPAERRLQQS